MAIDTESLDAWYDITAGADWKTFMAAFIYNAAMRDDKFPCKPMPGGQPAAR